MLSSLAPKIKYWGGYLAVSATMLLACSHKTYYSCTVFLLILTLTDCFRNCAQNSARDIRGINFTIAPLLTLISQWLLCLSCMCFFFKVRNGENVSQPCERASPPFNILSRKTRSPPRKRSIEDNQITQRLHAPAQSLQSHRHRPAKGQNHHAHRNIGEVKTRFASILYIKAMQYTHQILYITSLNGQAIKHSSQPLIQLNSKKNPKRNRKRVLL